MPKSLLRTEEQRITELEKLVDKLEKKVRDNQGENGVAVMQGDIDMNGYRITGLGDAGSSDDAASYADVNDNVSERSIIEETLTSTGTSHQLAHPPLDSSKVKVYLDGNKMKQGSSGNRGYTITVTGAITTIRSITAEDELVAEYTRKRFR
jgi:hypothetical protein